MTKDELVKALYELSFETGAPDNITVEELRRHFMALIELLIKANQKP